MFFYIWKNLWQDKLRFFLSVLGVTLAVILITVIQGFLWGIYKQLAAYPTNSGADFWVAQEGVESLMMTYSVIPGTVKENLLKVSEIEEVTGIYYFPAIFDHADIKAPVTVIGYDTNRELGRPWSIVEGDLLKKFPLVSYLSKRAAEQTRVFHKQLKEGEVIFDKALSELYGLRVGDRVEIMDRDFRIVGFSGDTASWIAAPLFVSREEAARLLGLRSGEFYNFILVRLKPHENADLVKRKIIGRIPDIEVWKTRELIRNDKVLMDDLFLGPILMMTFIAFVIGVLIIGLTIYTTTLQKIREYGILKAIGAGNGRLYTIVLIQTFLISLLGFFFGGAVSVYLDFLTNRQLDTKFMVTVTPSNLTLIFAATLLMSLIASYLPARRVFYIDPSLVFKD